MKTRDLVKIGIPAGPCAEAAKQILNRTHGAKRRMSTVLDDLGRVATSPATFVDDPINAISSSRWRGLNPGSSRWPRAGSHRRIDVSTLNSQLSSEV
jgi:hypothetical protein